MVFWTKLDDDEQTCVQLIRVPQKESKGLDGLDSLLKRRE